MKKFSRYIKHNILNLIAIVISVVALSVTFYQTHKSDLATYQQNLIKIESDLQQIKLMNRALLSCWPEKCEDIYNELKIDNFRKYINILELNIDLYSDYIVEKLDYPEFRHIADAVDLLKDEDSDIQTVLAEMNENIENLSKFIAKHIKQIYH